MQKDKKVLFVDLDGTILSKSYKITKQNKIAVNSLFENDIKVIIATGRGPTRITKVYKKLNMEKHKLPIICFNGAGIFNFDTQTFIKTLCIDSEKSKKIFILAKKYGISIWGFSDNNKDSYYYGRNSLTRFFTLRFYNLNRVKFNEKTFNDNLIKISFSAEKSSAKKFIQEINNMNLKVFSHIFHITKKYLWDIATIDSDKYTAIKWYMENNNLKNEDIIAIGDGENDLKMITNAGLGIAMGNAINKVKENANITTDSVKNNGLAKAVKKYIL